MKKEAINVPGFPTSKLFSRMTKFGNLVFISGTTGRDPVTSELAGPDIASQTHQALKNVEGTLKAVGGDLSNVLKITAYLVDFVEKAQFDDVYVQYFPVDPPARNVAQVGDPGTGMRLELQVVAGLSD